MSKPISIWTEKDIWEYHDKYNIRFCEVYYKRVTEEGVEVSGERQTGCVICAFGAEQDKGDMNRFQKLKLTHPKMHNFLYIIQGLGRY